MLDRYVTGRVDRVSPEAPIPVMHIAREGGIRVDQTPSDIFTSLTSSAPERSSANE